MKTRDDFPEDLRPSFDSMALLFDTKDVRNDDLFMESVTWNHWARNRTNKELVSAVMWVRATLVRDGCNHLSSQLNEVIRRLNRRPGHRRLFPEERELSKKGK